MFSADKTHVFSFRENWENQFKAFKTQKPIITLIGYYLSAPVEGEMKEKKTFTFLNFTHFLKDSRNVLRSVNDCSIKFDNILQKFEGKKQQYISSKNLDNISINHI